MITDPVPASVGGVGVIMGGGRLAHLSLNVAGAGAQYRVAINDGCSFNARPHDGKFELREVDCEPLPSNSLLAAGGIMARSNLVFGLDPLARYFHYFTRSTVNAAILGGNETGTYYALCEGHALRAGDPPVARIRYSGKTGYSRDHAAGESCKVEVQGDASGILRLEPGATSDDLTVYEEGVGCTTHARRAEGQLFKADETDCELSDVGIKQLGVTARHYTAFQIDLATKTWGYSSVTTRTIGADEVVQQCFQLTADLTGELPTP